MTLRLLPAALALPLAAGIAVGASYVEPLLVAAVLVAQALAAVSWHPAAGLPGARVGAGIALGAAVAADIAVLTADDDRPLGRIAVVLGVVVVAAIGQQLTRPAPRTAVTASWSATVAVAALAGLAASFLALPDLRDGPALAAAAALPVAAVVLVLSSPVAEDRRRGHPAAVVAGLLTALVVAVVSSAALTTGLLVGGAAAVSGWVGAVLVARLAARRSLPLELAAGAVPLLVVAPLAYVLGRLLAG